MPSSPEHQISDQGDLRHWRTELPNIIDDLGLDPFERTLYAHYKKVCGANGGTCTEAVRTTAKKTGMSTGKVSETRRELSQKGLITEHEQPPRDNQISSPVHITIIDIWQLNFLYYSVMKSYPKICPDIHGWTIKQLQEWTDSVHQVNARSSGERENGRERSSGERKKEHDSKKEPIEEKGAAEKTPPAPTLRDQAKRGEITTETELALLCGFGRQGKAGIADSSQDQEQHKRYSNPFVDTYHQVTNLHPEKREQLPAIEALSVDKDPDVALWEKIIRKWLRLGWNPRNVDGMLDCYDRREIPTARKNGGKPNARRIRPELDAKGQAISAAIKARARSGP